MTGNSHFESQPENFRARELDWSQAEAMLEARLFLMEPEARLILKSIRAHECQQSFEALLKFFGTLELVEDEMTFASAIKILDTVYRAFEQIDVDHDQILTREELDHFSKNVSEKEERSALVWLLSNYRLLEHANLSEGTRITERAAAGLSRKDLLEAGCVFRGLKHVQENFELVSEIAPDGELQVTAASIHRYLAKKKERLSLRERVSLKHLAHYIARITRRDLEHDGLNFDALVHLGPEDIWGETD